MNESDPTAVPSFVPVCMQHVNREFIVGHVSHKCVAPMGQIWPYHVPALLVPVNAFLLLMMSFIISVSHLCMWVKRGLFVNLY